MKKELSRKPVYVIAGLFVALLIVAGGVLVVARTNPAARQAMLESPFVQHFKHTYNSIKKLGDIFFIPYLFAPSALPTYSITIPLANIELMNAALPTDSFSGTLGDTSNPYVKAQFKDPQTGYNDSVHIKYRGTNANHWNALQKSYRIQFPSTDFFHGQRVVNFVTPYDRKYYGEPLNMYRAKKLGLLSLDMQFVRLTVNGIDNGVYLEFEEWTPELLAKKSMTESTIFGSVNGANNPNPVDNYENLFNKLDTKKEELAALLDIRGKADDATFKRLLPQIMDMDKLYSWDILTILSGSTHQSDSGNAVFYFDAGVGKFELVPWDTEVADVSQFPYDDTTSLLVSRAMSIPEFRAERDRRLRAYLDDPKNLADDLAFYDKLAATTKTDFLKDTYKFDTDLTYLSDVAQYRQWIVNAFNAANKVASPSYTYPKYTPSGTPSFFGSFAHLTELMRTIDEFLAWNPQFYKIDEHTVGLSGTQIFRSDVRIPPNVTLDIAQGTSLFLDAGVSIFVRGPIHAEGTVLAPVSVSRLNPSKPWGTIAVIGANATSTLSHVIADGGSGTTEEGITITGMVAFHGGDVSIDHSSFSNSGNDDSVNTNYAVTRITNSFFTQSYSDAIDVNFAKKGSLFEGNRFVDVGKDGNGDCMDLSGSTVEIRNNTVNVCNDKAVSSGERSYLDIEGNTFIGCNYGVAVKDLSEAYIAGNTFDKNAIAAIGLYQKKQTFGGGHAIIGKNTFSDSEIKVKPDAVSSVEYLP